MGERRALMTLTYKRKFTIALVVSIIGGLAIASGSAEISGSFGVRQLVDSGLTKLVIGLLIFIPSAPLAVYYAARKNAPVNSMEPEIKMLIDAQKEQNKSR